VLGWGTERQRPRTTSLRHLVSLLGLGPTIGGISADLGAGRPLSA